MNEKVSRVKLEQRKKNLKSLTDIFKDISGPFTALSLFTFLFFTTLFHETFKIENRLLLASFIIFSTLTIFVITFIIFARFYMEGNSILTFIGWCIVLSILSLFLGLSKIINQSLLDAFSSLKEFSYAWVLLIPALLICIFSYYYSHKIILKIGSPSYYVYSVLISLIAFFIFSLFVKPIVSVIQYLPHVFLTVLYLGIIIGVFVSLIAIIITPLVENIIIWLIQWIVKTIVQIKD